MILLIGFVTLFFGQLLENKTRCVSKFLATKKGQYLFGSNVAIFFTELSVVLTIVLIMAILNININYIVPFAGIVLGQLMLIILVSNNYYKYKK